MKKKLISHEEALQKARQDFDFLEEERKIKLYFDLAKQIYTLRKSAGLSQKELAERSNTFQTRISKIENAELNANLSTIVSIAEALDCDVSIEFKKRKEEQNDHADPIKINLNVIDSMVNIN